MPALVVGLVGGGTVGGGVYDILENKRVDAIKKLGVNIKVKLLAVHPNDVNKDLGYKIASHTKVIGDWKQVVEDPEIDTVVEVMGGTTIAKDVVFSAIKNGKNVVTANKALLAAFQPELSALLAQNPNCKFGYEAAVCGGIPIIQALQQDYLGDRITNVLGIMNGTTNFMLTKMETGADYAEVLREAQALGYAEADPTADVEGHDVRAKIALIAKLAYGVSVPIESIATKGISSITSIDFEYAKLLHSTIKLLGMAKLSEDGTKLSVAVSPFIVPMSHPIATTSGSINIVNITSDNVVSSSFTGPGAGRYPTANSVVSDIIRIARGYCSPAFPLESKLPLEPDYTSRFYVRLKIREQLGVIRVVGELAERHGVSIYAILQTPFTDANNVDFVVTTEPAKFSQVDSLCRDLSKESFVKGPPVFFGCL